MNLRERHAHRIKDHREAGCDAALLLAAGDALAEATEELDCLCATEVAREKVHDALAAWKKVTDGR